MDKLKCNIYAPIGEYSYYGDKSRVYIKRLLETRPDLDIRIIEYQTNNTRNGYFDNALKQYVVAGFPDPDVCFYIGHPSLYNAFGSKANIGFLDTTSILSNDDVKLFVDKCNCLSSVFVASNYAKITLQNLRYMNGAEEVKITTPIIITTEFSTIQDIEAPSVSLLGSIRTQRNFLLIGRWNTEISDEFGGRNKDNISYVVSNYLNTFKDIDDAPGLIVNVYGDVPGTVDKRNLENKLNEIKKSISFTRSLPKIYLLNGILSQGQTKALYDDPKVIALIHTPQRTDSVEPELDFMSVGKPIIYSGFGSQMEVLNYEGNFAVNCAIKELKVDVDGAGPRLADVYGDYIKYALYETYYHYETLRETANSNGKIFLSTNNKARALHIFSEAFKYFVPIVQEEQKPLQERAVENVQDIPIVEEVTDHTKVVKKSRKTKK